jgi:hypothetical protein
MNESPRSYCTLTLIAVVWVEEQLGLGSGCIIESHQHVRVRI